MGHAHTQAFGLARGISFAFPGDVHLRHNQHGRQQFPDLLHERQELPFTVQRHLGIQRPADHFLRPCGFQRLLHVVAQGVDTLPAFHERFIPDSPPFGHIIEKDGPGIVVFTVLPLIFMISMAFTSYDHKHLVLFHWVGFENFAKVFSNSGGTVNAALFGRVLVWTLVWAFFATFLNFFFGMFVAMIINRKTTHFKGFWRACFSMSIAVPQFVSLLVMHTMLQPQGAVNRMLQTWGWIDGPLPFFTNATWARVTVIIINLWVGIPSTIMQITGILQNIPADQYEAAKIDGANWWQIFTKITMPYIIFVLTPYLITTFTGNVNNFNVIYLLSGGDPTPLGDSAGSTDLLITWLYKLTVDKQDYNLGAVIGIMTFVVLAIVSLITYRNSGSYKNEEAFR